MKSSYKLIIPFFLLTVLSWSCEDSLNRTPESNLSELQFWQTEQNFKEASNRLYTFVDAEDYRFGSESDNRTDHAFGEGPNFISDGTRTVPATSNSWDEPYEMIFTANKIIEKASEVDDIEGIDRWVAEARFWRAWAYFDLVSKYGGVPLVLNVLDIDSPELEQGKTDRSQIIDQIYDDLDFAAENLPSFIEVGEEEYGRVSRSSALAFKSRVSLYEGTRQKYHDYGNPQDHLQIAIEASESTMAEGHELYSDDSGDPYYNLFQYAGEGFQNKENILTIIYGESSSNNIRDHNIGRRLENGAANVTRSMVELYLATDGLPADKSPLAEEPEIDPMSIFTNKDPRMSASLFKDGDPYGNPSTYDMTSSSYILTFFAGRKYSIVADWSAGESFVDYALIRYAEVLLNFAEAKYELNGTISDADLDKSINLIRDRVSMPPLTNSFVENNGLDMRNEIRRERAVELAQEGFRYNDINRWKIAEDVLPERIVGATYFEDEYNVGSIEVSEDGLVLVQKAEDRHFDPQKDYLYPIPTREISLSGGNIEQNPGW